MYALRGSMLSIGLSRALGGVPPVEPPSNPRVTGWLRAQLP